MDAFLFDVRTPHGRAMAMRATLMHHPIPQGKLYVDWLDQVVHTGIHPIAEWCFVSSFRSAVLESGTTLGAAWREFDLLMKAVGRANRLHPPPRPDANKPAWRPQAINLSWNLWQSIEALDAERDERARLHVAMSGIVQLNGLLCEHVKVLHAEHRIQTQDPARRAALERWMGRWVNLTWNPGLAIRFRELRNAWSHGDTWMDGSAVRVYRKGTRNEITVLSLKDLRAYLDAGMAAWAAFNLWQVVNTASARGMDAIGRTQGVSIEEILAENPRLREMLRQLEEEDAHLEG